MVELIPVAEDHRGFVTALRNDPEVVSLGLSRTPASPTWFEKHQGRMRLITERGGPMGYLITAPLDELTIVLSSSARGRGVGTEAIALLTAQSSARLILARIQDSNAASIRAFHKAGFHELFGIRSLYWAPR